MAFKPNWKPCQSQTGNVMEFSREKEKRKEDSGITERKLSEICLEVSWAMQRSRWLAEKSKKMRCAHTQGRDQMHKRTHTCKHTRLHTYIQPRTPTHIYTYTYTPTYKLTQYTHLQTHTCTLTNKHTYAYTHALTTHHLHTPTHTYTHAYTQCHAQLHIYTYEHTMLYCNIHTRARTHTYSYTIALNNDVSIAPSSAVNSQKLVHRRRCCRRVLKQCRLNACAFLSCN